MKKRIIIIDDEPLIPVLIKDMINGEDGFEVSKITDTKEGFLKAIEQDLFDVALVDFSFGQGRDGGINILEILKNQKISLPAIILSAHSEIDYGFKCLEAGAKGYISKSHISSSLIQGLNEVCSDRLFVSGNKGAHVLDRYQKRCIATVGTSSTKTSESHKLTGDF